MQPRKAVTAVAALVALVLTGAWSCNTQSRSSSGGHDFPPPAPTRGHEHDPNPGAQPEAPPADPGPQQSADLVVLKVSWVGERAGEVEISINNVVQVPRRKAPRPTRVGSHYSGIWEETFTLSGVKQIGFTWFPAGPGMQAQCSVWNMGIVRDAHGVQGGPCAASWTR